MAVTVEAYQPMVRSLAARMCAYLPKHLSQNELEQWGMMGLMDALKKWDPNSENTFKTYAEIRIRGAIFDELRKQDWVPRSVRDREKSCGEIPLRMDTTDPQAFETLLSSDSIVLEKMSTKEDVTRFLEGHLPINRAVFCLYYIWGLTLKEIGECFGQSESRMSQRLLKVRSGVRDAEA